MTTTTPAPGITTWPVYRDGHPFTIREVHEGDLFGMVTLRGEAGEVTVSADEVHRRLYAVRVTYQNGWSAIVTGSFRQPLTWTWTEAQEWVEHASALPTNAGVRFTVEVAAA